MERNINDCAEWYKKSETYKNYVPPTPGDNRLQKKAQKLCLKYLCKICISKGIDYPYSSKDVQNFWEDKSICKLADTLKKEISETLKTKINDNQSFSNLLEIVFLVVVALGILVAAIVPFFMLPLGYAIPICIGGVVLFFVLLIGAHEYNKEQKRLTDKMLEIQRQEAPQPIKLLKVSVKAFFS